MEGTRQPINYSQQATILYMLIGKAVWSIQLLEDAINHSIALKNPEATNRTKGDKILSSYRKLTLGQAVKRAAKRNVFEEILQNKLEGFLTERNWLIHKCMYESVDEMGLPLDPEKLFAKVNAISASAVSFKEEVEIDMLRFMSANGRPDIRETVARHYVDWQKRLAGE